MAETDLTAKLTRIQLLEHTSPPDLPLEFIRPPARATLEAYVASILSSPTSTDDLDQLLNSLSQDDEYMLCFIKWQDLNLPELAQFVSVEHRVGRKRYLGRIWDKWWLSGRKENYDEFVAKLNALLVSIILHTTRRN